VHHPHWYFLVVPSLTEMAGKDEAEPGDVTGGPEAERSLFCSPSFFVAGSLIRFV
jgi:hypothetical protein